MAKTDFKSIDHYIASQPPASRPVLEKVRSTLRKALPNAQEVISYQICAFRLREGIVIYFAGWKEHYSLYPATAGVIATFKRELASYEVSKGTIRFPLSEAVPVRLIAAIAKLRAKETLERKQAGAAAKKKAAKKKPAKKKAAKTSSAKKKAVKKSR